jgi:hypothetical protein
MSVPMSEGFWEADRIWKRLGGTALLAAVLAWGLAGSEALFPLRVVAEWPAELGRSLAVGLFAGHAEWPRLMPGGARGLPPGGLARFAAGALGVLSGVLASALALWLASTPARARLAARGLGALLLVASLFPPYGMIESLPVLVAALALLGLGLLGTPEACAQALLIGSVWSGLGALWQMEGPLFRSGRPGPDLDGLSQATGLPPLLWAALAACLCLVGWWRVLRPARAVAATPVVPPIAGPGSTT